jgi:zinc protease
LRKYETNDQKAAFLGRMQLYDLSADFVDKQNKILAGITQNEINVLAKNYLDVSRMVILIVGDKEKTMPGLQKLGYQVVELDADGNTK